MKYEPAIRVLRDCAIKARQAAIRSSDAGFSGNATQCRELADIYDASVDLLQRSSDAADSGDGAVSPTCKTEGALRCEDSFLSSLGGKSG
jgi:hypothetical protein